VGAAGTDGGGRVWGVDAGGAFAAREVCGDEGPARRWTLSLRTQADDFPLLILPICANTSQLNLAKNWPETFSSIWQFAKSHFEGSGDRGASTSRLAQRMSPGVAIF